MERIEEPLRYVRDTRRFVVYEGGATVPHVYIAKGALPRPYPAYVTVVISRGDDGAP